MTDTEKLTMLKAMTGEKDESVLSTYLFYRWKQSPETGLSL